MDIKDFHRLFSYDGWANREVLAALHERPNPRALQLAAHILAAQTLWLERLRQQPQSTPVWPSPNRQECEAQAQKLSGLWRDYLTETGDAGLERNILYKNTVGESWSNRVADVLMHVIMHSAYHRGQIATAMRSAGTTPAYTDFIHSIRQGFVE